jgi:diacylglycerol kinase family enzyme
MVALNTNIATLPTKLRRVPVERKGRRLAVVLNANARRVDAETLRWVSAAVPGEDLFLSRSIEDGRRAADTIVTKGYDAVLWGGGDGTFAAGIAALADSARRRGRRLPEVGVLALGTGNAMASALGAAPASADTVADEIRRARAEESRRTMQLLAVEGKPTMFCGFGLDAQILDDFGATVKALERFGLADRVKNAGLRYALAVTSRSLPRFVLSQRVEVVAVNRGAPAIKIDRDGNPIGAPIATGRVLWRGTASMASAGAIPFYGLGMKIFPHANKLPGRFQLRLSDMGAAEILARLPAVWRGQAESKRLHDFLVDRVELMVARPAPFQSAGDLIGDRQQVTISMWDRPITVL